MITAFRTGGYTILIDYKEMPVKDVKGNFVPAKEEAGYNPGMIKMKNVIIGIQLIIPDYEGSGARIIPFSLNDIHEIYKTSEGILKEPPAPGFITEYESREF